MSSRETKGSGTLPKARIVGFTGHRLLKNPEAVALALGHELETAKASGIEIMAISSIASGADTVFAREVIRAGIKWMALLPMPKEIFKEDFSPSEWAEAERLLEQAAQVRILPGHERPQGYVDCGKATVDESDWLFAVWDGEPARGAGGTAEIVAYARALGREITCFRETEAGVDKIAPALIPPLNLEPTEILQAIGKPVELPNPPEILREYFDTCDEIATRTAPNFRRDNLRMLGLLLGATLIAGLSLSMNAEHIRLPGPILPYVLPLLKLFFVSWALKILITLKRKHTHDLWVRERLKAEYCRSLLATWPCAEPVEPVPIHAVPELRELSQAILLLRLEKARYAAVSVQQFRAAYAHHRVMDQMEYFKRQAGKALALAKPLHIYYWACTIAAVGFSGLALIRHLLKGHLGNVSAFIPAWGETLFDVLVDLSPLAFPALASFTLTRMAIEDVNRRIGRFQELQKEMRLALVDLSFCGSWASLRRTVERTEKVLLNEVLEWYSVSRYAKND